MWLHLLCTKRPNKVAERERESERVREQERVRECQRESERERSKTVGEIRKAS